jgi:hypothetical protein
MDLVREVLDEPLAEKVLRALSGTRLRVRERRIGVKDAARWVENLSRAEGLLADGSGRTAEIRLYGTGGDVVRDLAGTHGLAYAGSLPWAASPARLAGCPEIGALAAALITTAAGPAEDA